MERKVDCCFCGERMFYENDPRFEDEVEVRWSFADGLSLCGHVHLRCFRKYFSITLDERGLRMIIPKKEEAHG